ncbi:hypothetical protein PF005_g26150 [Phytophthora fragariae]|uniref:Uncharacterized protein n=2 Tax=Phytophthora TaxID=4783 RepID=A0A6A3WKV3_9STRA|nr:hypothetical protein PF003_g35986 [Phytophthora fragariae]KAE9044445.1 hypothetical protein PR002_g2819 [Phytophthora rubi]KAE8922746.1 hypothetical protein PF009_g26991 [Phytophthora fragariae]KAE8976117.1 hypothetical protein PF011_g24187 [Phytophthora fragariae]KAE9049946.1 hypothetical protein PR001_g2830 [Phytophthora rubi]
MTCSSVCCGLIAALHCLLGLTNLNCCIASAGETPLSFLTFLADQLRRPMGCINRQLFREN